MKSTGLLSDQEQKDIDLARLTSSYIFSSDITTTIWAVRSLTLLCFSELVPNPDGARVSTILISDIFFADYSWTEEILISQHYCDSGHSMRRTSKILTREWNKMLVYRRLTARKLTWWSSWSLRKGWCRTVKPADTKSGLLPYRLKALESSDARLYAYDPAEVLYILQMNI